MVFPQQAATVLVAPFHVRSANLPLLARLPLTIRVGGATPTQLRADLQAAGVPLNAAGQALLDDIRFLPALAASEVAIVATSVGALRSGGGGTTDDLLAAAAARGWQVCPIDLAVHLRLGWMDQPEGALGQPITRHRAPPGAVTVMSAPIDLRDDAVPKGFYLRRIDGVPWLRGYRCGADHVWSPEDVVLFQQENGA